MPGVVGQLVNVLSPPRPTANVTYTVTVSLRPESLGEVQATVTAGQNQVAVRLVATTPSGAAAIQQALPQLHEALSTGGQRASVTLSGSNSGAPSQFGLTSGASNGGGAPTHSNLAHRPAQGMAPAERPERPVMPMPAMPNAPRRSRTGATHLVDVRV